MSALPECDRQTSDFDLLLGFGIIDGYYDQMFLESGATTPDGYLYPQTEAVRKFLCFYPESTPFLEAYVKYVDANCILITDQSARVPVTREVGEHLLKTCPELGLTLPPSAAPPKTVPPTDAPTTPAPSEPPSATTTTTPEPTATKERLPKTNDSSSSSSSSLSSSSAVDPSLIAPTTSPVSSTTTSPSVDANQTDASSGLDTLTWVGTCSGGIVAVSLLLLFFTRRRRSTSRHDYDGMATPHQPLPPFGVPRDMRLVRKIPADQLHIGKCISRGGFGKVYQAMFDGQLVAIKRLLPARRKEQASIDAFMAEIQLTAMLVHPCIVKFIGVTSDSPAHVGMVTELMTGGDLRELLTRYNEVNVPTGFDNNKLKIALHVTQALAYLHGLEPVVIHRDLKSRNILLTAGMDAKLMDFGVSRKYHARTATSDDRNHVASTMTAAIGSSLWMAPEVIMGDQYDAKADVYSLGVVLSELDTHALPYDQATTMSSGERLPDVVVMQLVLDGNVTAQFTETADPSVEKLARECMQMDAALRPTSAEVAQRLEQIMRSEM